MNCLLTPAPKLKQVFAAMLCLFFTFTTTAQVQVIVNVVPPFQLNLSDYASTPGRVIITLINNATTDVNIQLAGTIKGDNGVVLKTKPDYRSNQPIRIGGNQSYIVNSAEIAELFDLSAFNYSGITRQQIERTNSLPEGDYQLCVQAFLFRTLTPLSGTDPIGCSNIFPIQSIEPPVILTPLNEQVINENPAPTIIFNWSTPAATKPGTIYILKIVEIIGNKNPNDAIRSSVTTRFFEEQVQGNTFIYGPQQPALIPGSKYAVMVTAQDPFGKSIFRNNGNSEVISFVYGNALIVNIIPAPNTPKKDDLPKVTIKGKVLWAFKKQEEDKVQLNTKTNEVTNGTGITTNAIKSNYNGAFNVVSNTPPVGKAAPATYTVSTSTLTNMNLALLANLDATLSPTNALVTAINNGNDVSPAGYVSKQVTVWGSGETIGIAAQINATKEQGVKQYNLEGATIKIIGIKNPVASTPLKLAQTNLSIANAPIAQHVLFGIYQQPGANISPNTKSNLPLAPAGNSDGLQPMVAIPQTDLIATETSGPDGSFNFTSIDPSYIAGKNYDKISITIEQRDFETYKKEYNAKDFINTLDIGSIVLNANTFRFSPTLKSKDNLNLTDASITIYRTVITDSKFNYYKQEGTGAIENIKGVDYYKIATLKSGEEATKIFYNWINYSAPLLIKIESKNFITSYNTLGIAPNMGTDLSQVFSIKKRYNLEGKLPTISGIVSSFDGSTKLPLKGAIVVLDYETSELEDPAVATAESNPANAQNPGLQAASNQLALTQTHLNSSLQQALQLSPALALLNPQIKTYHGKKSVITDSTGYYSFSDIPMLKNGGSAYRIIAKAPQLLDDTAVAAVLAADVAKAQNIVKNLELNPDVANITGTIVDAAGIPIPNAQAYWYNGGDKIDTDDKGFFTAKHIPGEDTLYMSKFGFVKGKLFVKIDKPASTKTIQNSGSKVQKSNSKSASNNTVLQPVSNIFLPQLLLPLEKTTQEIVMGNIGYLKKSIAKIKFIVQSANNNKNIPNVKLQLPDTTGNTNQQGEWLYVGNGGKFDVNVLPDAANNETLAPTQITINANDDGEEMVVPIKLKTGVKLTGKVTAANVPQKDAGIFIKDYIQTTSDANGNYVLIVPASNQTVQANKSGFISVDFTSDFIANSPVVHDFVLGDAGGKNISKLLGFDIEVEKIETDGPNFKMTGNFVKLKGNNIFTPKAEVKLKFTNLKLSFDNAGNPIVPGDTVRTDATEIEMKAFNFLPIKLLGQNTNIVIQKSKEDGIGRIGGKIQVSVEQILESSGLKFDLAMAKPYMKQASVAAPINIYVFTSNGTIPYDLNFALGYAKNEVKDQAQKLLDEAKAEAQKMLEEAKKMLDDAIAKANKDIEAEARKLYNDAKTKGDGLIADATQKVQQAAQAVSQATGINIPNSIPQELKVKVYGFEAILDLTKSTINKGGLSLAGVIKTPPIPFIQVNRFDISEFKISPALAIQSIVIKPTPAPTLIIASWSATLKQLSFSPSGFKIDGNVNVQLPSSVPSLIDFIGLKFSLDALYDGAVNLTKGLDIFNIVKLQSGTTPLKFGQIGNSGVYLVKGSGSIQMPKVFDKKLELDYFQIQSDFNFDVKVPYNYSTTIAKIVGVDVTGFEVNSIGKPFIGIKGGISIKSVKFIKFEAGDFKFTYDNGQVGVNISKFAGKLDIPIIKSSIGVEIKDDENFKGIAGSGSLEITGTPLKGDAEFHVFEDLKNNGIDFLLGFSSKVRIPIGGPALVLTRMGGSVNFNTGTGDFKVALKAGAEVTGGAVKIDPVEVSVASGPVIAGTVDVVLTALPTVPIKGKISMDFPNSMFDVEAVFNGEIVPEVNVEARAKLAISGKPGDSFFFLGIGASADLGGMGNIRNVAAIGIGVNDARDRDATSFYLHDAPIDYLPSHSSFSGFYYKNAIKLGKTQAEAPSIDVVGLFSAKVWMYSYSSQSFIANVDRGGFQLRLSGGLGGGIDARVVKVIHLQASLAACYDIYGGYNQNDGWNFNGMAAGKAEIAIGDDASCNNISLVAPGVHLCINAKAQLGFTTRSGFNCDLSIGGDSADPCNLPPDL